MISVVSGYALIGEMPSPTAMPVKTIGVGEPILNLRPTEAPSLELVKRHLAKKAVTNTCSEWTISDGIGYTPICDFSETCLFTSATDGNLYEGCGQTSIAYNWITYCWDYGAKTGLPPVSQTYCPASAPYCGYFMFVYDSENTFYNFGCSFTSYSSTAYLVANNSTTTALAGGGTTKITQPPTVTATVTKGSDSSTSPTTEFNSPSSSTSQGSSGDSTTSLPTIKSPGKKKKKAPIGAIVGGVIGGIALIAIAGFLIWFCLRKRAQDKAKAQNQQQQADAATAAAFHNPNRISEMGGDPKPPTVFPPGAGYGQGVPEKPIDNPTTQEMYGSASPPPVYAQPPPPNSPPISNYTELDNTGRQSVPPISPVGTHTNVASPAVSELGGTNRMSELSGANQPNYNAYNPTMPEMSATAPQVQRPVRQSGVDMSGAPLEPYQPHEMP